MNKEQMGWYQFDNAVDILAKEIKKMLNIKRIYGIPRNGLVLAVALSHKLNIPLLSELKTSNDYELNQVLVVDDISDTGTTLRKYKGIPTATIYYKPKTSKCKPTVHVFETDNFIVFPWETEESAKADYLEDE